MCKHPLYGLTLSPPRFMFSSPPVPAVSPGFIRWHSHLLYIPTYYILYYAIVTLQCFGPHPRSQKALPIIKFTISVWSLLSGILQRRFAWEPQLTFELTPSNISHLISSDQRSHCPLFTLSHGSHCSHCLWKLQRHGWTPKLPVSTKCAALIATETCPKITALEFQGNFEDGNLRW